MPADPDGENGRSRADALRWGGAAAVAYGIGMTAVAVVIGVVVRATVPTPAELLADVTDARALWVPTQALLAILQVLLVPVAIAVHLVLGGRDHPTVTAALAFFGLAGVAYVASGVFHGVLGVHLARPGAGDGAGAAVLVAETELVHAFGDTWWFVGVAATALATALLVGPIRRSPALPAGLATVGLAAVVLDAVQLLWFFLPAAGTAGPLGAILHAVWFCWLGVRLRSLAVEPVPIRP
jgi:hypothetical protein